MERRFVRLMLIRFFETEFAEDAAGVGEWLEGFGINPDEFVKAVEKLTEE